MPTASPLVLAGWNYALDEDELESRWSVRAVTKSLGNGEIRVAFGWRDARNFALLRLSALETALYEIKNGATRRVIAQPQPLVGSWTLQVVGNRVRVLRGDNLALETSLVLMGKRFGSASKGGAQWEFGGVQPTESVQFRDDFMRSGGPNELETPNQWQTIGSWKTSGALGPKSDAALNPNPFVFRAGSETETQDLRRKISAVRSKSHTARVGHWFWSDYSVGVSVRAPRDSPNDLTANIAAFADEKNSGIRAVMNFRSGVVHLYEGEKLLASSAPFELELGQWHRVRLDPGPGNARFWVNGIERVNAKTTRAQGQAALGVSLGETGHVDFDDVRIGKSGENDFFGGEAALPSRFSKDRLMQFWANDARLWKRDARGVWWHIGDFFGQNRISFKVPKWNLGQGAAVVRDARVSPASAQRPGARVAVLDDSRVTISRVLAGYTLEVRGAGGFRWSQTLPANRMENQTFAVVLRRDAKSALLSREISVGGQVLRRDSVTSAGSRVGILPLRNGAPLPPPVLKPLSIYIGTIGRDGRAVIGVNITPVSEEIRREMGLPDSTGAVVDHVDEGSPAIEAGVQIGDVIRGVNGVRVVDVETMRGAVGSVRPGARVKIEVLRAQGDGSGLDWALANAKTGEMLDYSFTSAPVDWRAARGKWEIAERWTCSPQWSFFAGTDDVSPALWSRFATRGDWTLEAYLATPMDLTRGERSPSEINLTAGGDGENLSSGTSFLFAAQGRAKNQIWRGNALAWQSDFEMPGGIGDTHQDWFYTRLEKRSDGEKTHYVWSVNGKEITRYTDENPLPDGGKFAFWSKNGGLSVARVRLWHSGLREPVAAPFTPRSPQSSETLKNEIGEFSVRGAGQNASSRIALVEEKTLEISNPHSGGDWTTFVSRTPFSAKDAPQISFDYRMRPDVKLNLYAQIAGVWREIEFTGGASANDEAHRLGAIEVKTDGAWHRAMFDLKSALEHMKLDDSTIEALAFAAPSRDYIQAGIGGNARGAKWWLRDFHVN